MTARQERDAALAQVEENTDTDPEWAEYAENLVREIASGPDAKRLQFSSDDVWDLLRNDEIAPPHEPRALGPIMRRLIVEQVISPVGFAVSRRRHGGTVRTYLAR